MSETNIVPAAQPANKVQELLAFIGAPSVVEQITKVLPSNLTADRLIRQTLSLASKTPKLLECTKTSILLGLMQAAELGLELTGPLGHCYLIPRWHGKNKRMEATFQMGYRGLSALAFRSGKVASMPVRVVYEHDFLDVRYGTNQHLTHIPSEDADRGESKAFYTVVNFVSGGFDFEVMSKAECQRHRAKYSKDTTGFSPWDTAFDAMACKTTTRMLCKRLPMCPEAQEAAVREEYDEAEQAGLMRGGDRPSRADEVLTQLEGVGSEPVAEGETP